MTTVRTARVERHFLRRLDLQCASWLIPDNLDGNSVQVVRATRRHRCVYVRTRLFDIHVEVALPLILARANRLTASRTTVEVVRPLHLCHCQGEYCEAMDEAKSKEEDSHDRAIWALDALDKMTVGHALVATTSLKE